MRLPQVASSNAISSVVVSIYLKKTNTSFRKEGSISKEHDSENNMLLLHMWQNLLCFLPSLRVRRGRLPEILIVPREKTPRGAAARGKPSDGPVLAS